MRVQAIDLSSIGLLGLADASPLCPRVLLNQLGLIRSAFNAKNKGLLLLPFLQASSSSYTEAPTGAISV